MAIRRKSRRDKNNGKSLRKLSSRALFLEALEPRQLLANGPELVTVLPNAGSFLVDGQVRTDAPRELTLRFSPGQALDATTLGGIVITRAGGDGDFETSNVYSDFNTSDAVEVGFDAVRLGAGGNGIAVSFTKSILNQGGVPKIVANVPGKAITVTLDSTPGAQTNADQLVQAMADDANASLLVTASIRKGSGATNITAPAITYSPLTTGGANAAYSATDFNTGGPLGVLFRAVTAGTSGNGITLAFKKADLGASAPPSVSVSSPATNPPTPATISVTLNTHAGSLTTAQGLVTAINTNATAKLLVQASIPVGSSLTDITTPQLINPVVLGGANDVTSSPGYEALNGTNTNEVTYRFADSLPNDLYRIEVYGTAAGTSATVLKNQAGLVFNGGQDDRMSFTLDLGAQVTAVVPQPVLRDKVITVGSVTSLRDGDRIFLTAGGNQVTLELEDTVNGPAGVLTGNVLVPFNKSTDSASNVAAAIRDAINTSPLLNLDAVATASGNKVTITGNAYNPTATLLTSLTGGSSPLSVADGGLTQATDVVTVNFSVDQLKLADAQNPAFYQLIDTATNVIRTPQSVVYDATRNKAKLVFASGALSASATYRLQIGTSQEADATMTAAVKLGALFSTAGFSTTAVLGDSANGNKDVDLYQLQLASNGIITVTATPDAALQIRLRLFDSQGNAIADGYPGATNTVMAAVESAGTYYVGVSSDGNGTYDPTNGNNASAGTGGTGSYRLDIGTNAALTLSDNNSAYAAATDVGTLGVAGQTISAAITNQSYVLVPPAPGSTDIPGHRDIPSNFKEEYPNSNNTTPSAPGSIPVVQYFFPDVYGSDPNGNALHNQITEGQKQLTRDIFEMFSRYSGFQAEETANAGIPISTGDVRAADPTLDPLAVAGISSVIMNYIQNGNDNTYAGGWMGVALHEIGHAISLGHTSDLYTVMDGTGGGTKTETPLGDQDLVNLDRLHPANSTDIDLYKFAVTETGHVTAEITAERSSPTSALDAALTLFRDPYAAVTSDFGTSGAVSVNFTAANAGVFGNDVRLTFVASPHVAPYVGLPKIGVSGHDIAIDLDSNGTTANALIATLNANTFAKVLVRASLATPSATGVSNVSAIVSGTTLALSGGNREVIASNDDYYSNDPFLGIDLQPGTYYLGVTAKGNTSYDPTVSDSGFGGQSDGSYKLQLGFSPASTSSIADTDYSTLAATALDGDADGQAGGAFNFWFETGSTIFVDKASSTPAGLQDGTLASPFSTISAALQKAGSRIVVPSTVSRLHDGDYFSINDGTHGTLVFELDTNGSVVGSNIRVDISGLTAADQIASAIANAINTYDPTGINFYTTAVATGNLVDLTSASRLDVSGVKDPATPSGLLTAQNLVRIVGNGGTDSNLSTMNDNTAYRIGVSNLGATLPDGRTFDLPQGVTVMIDAGAIIKLQSANIDAGTATLGVDRQDGAVQILGTPDTRVYLTSFRNDTLGGDSDGASSGPQPGNWGGVVFRQDSDLNDNVFGDRDYTGSPVFLNAVYQADVSYGGGQVDVGGTLDVYDPIHLVMERPTIAFNRITNSADAAISADPNSFDDSSGRIGPDVHGNTLLSNSLNGLFVRIKTSAGVPIDKLTVTARFDDTDITHIITENLEIVGNPGGDIVNNDVQQLNVLGQPTGGYFTLTYSGGTAIRSGTTLNQAITNLQTSFFVASATVFPPVDTDSTSVDFIIKVDGEEMGVKNIVGNTLTVVRGFNGTAAVAHSTNAAVRCSQTTTRLSSTASAAEIQAALEALDGIGAGNVRVTGGNLPQAPVYIEFRHLLGSQNINPLTVNNAPPSWASLSGGTVVMNTVTDGGVKTARLGGRLEIDPGVVVKLGGARIESERGSSQVIAEGTAELPVILTSLRDDRYGGASGTFDTANDLYTAYNPNLTNVPNMPAPGDWGGLLFNLNTRGSIDHAYVAFAGGVTPVEGGAGSFNAVEIHEATVRLADSTFEYNANGTSNSGPDGKRSDRESNGAATVFVRGAQPIIVNNIFHNNFGAVVNIDADALKAISVTDWGRATGAADAFIQFADNQGPLVRLNRMAIDASLNGKGAVLGMQIRGQLIDTATVWDDTDIVHVLSGTISDDNLYTYGGIRLVSAPDASLVVKMLAGAGFSIGDPDKNNDGQLSAAGHTDDGPLDVNDRIGGSMQIAGAAGFPVVITSIKDDAVGASLDPSGFPQTDTNGDGSATTPAAGDWNEILFDKYANDRNVVLTYETEKAFTSGVDANGTPFAAQNLGQLAPDDKSADENRRAGFEVHGHIAEDTPSDVDVYSFMADSGTQVWLDIDKTTPSLDTILELIDSSGTVLARSQSDAMSQRMSGAVTALPLQEQVNLGGDYYATTVFDAGMRVVLNGAAGTKNTYYVRVRSNPASTSQADTTNLTDLKGGLTSGQYQLQVRLHQRDEQPGVAVKFSDIRYAINGIHVQGLPYHSPLTGNTTEADGAGATETADDVTAGAIELGNLLYSENNTFSAAGYLNGATDVDFYKFRLDYKLIQEIGPATRRTWATVIDLDWADGLTRSDTSIAVFDQSGRLLYVGRESNVADDQAAPGQGTDVDDLSRGSAGPQDPFLGTVQLADAIANDQFYYLAVFNNELQPQALSANFLSTSGNTNVRLEPINSVKRIAEDHIGYQGYGSNGKPVNPVTAGPLLPITTAGLSTHVTPLGLSDVVLYVSAINQLRTVDPLTGLVETDFGAGGLDAGAGYSTEDIAIRSDGTMFGYQDVNPSGSNGTAGTAGRIVTIDSGTGVRSGAANDNVPGGDSVNPYTPTPTGQEYTTSAQVDALAWDKSPYDGTNLDTYGLYYAVRDVTNTQSRLFKAKPSTGSAAQATNYGLIGDISAVKATAGMVAPSNNMPNNSRIEFYARQDGLAGNNITITINNADLGTTGNPAVSVVGKDITVTANNNGSKKSTLTNVVDAINGNGAARALVTAAVGNNGGADVSGAGTAFMTSGGLGTPLAGYTTGMAEIADTLYGVSSAGELYSINKGNGVATLIHAFTLAELAIPGFTGFQGLTAGPENLHNGLFANSLFAITNNGYLVAFTTTGTLVNAFGSDNATQTLTQVVGGVAGDTFTLKYTYPSTGEVLTTTPLAYNANSAQVSAALQALVTSSGLYPFLAADINVAGGPLNAAPITVTFQGFYKDQSVATLTVDNSGMNGHNTSNSTTVIGGDGVRTTWAQNTGVTTPTGLAFSNLDINLWHPTKRQATVVGHGVTPVTDNTRTPSNESRVISDGTGNTRTESESQGGTSFYFGLEQYVYPGTTTPYLNYQIDHGQYGVLTNNWQRDLTSQAATGPASQGIRNNYNLPGGASGSVVTNPISLAAYTANDKPAIYFNYFLDTEAASATAGNTTMRDSARVFGSTDGGRTWTMLATNNTPLGVELPDFLAHSSTYNGSPVQELFDATPTTLSATIDNATTAVDVASTASFPPGDGNAGTVDYVVTIDNEQMGVLNVSGNRLTVIRAYNGSTAAAHNAGASVRYAAWRQARVDLSSLAGASSLIFRFDFATAGKVGQAALPGENYGNLTSTQRGQKNAYEGFYVDDIIVGFAERGEMVTSAPATTTGFDDLYTDFANGRANLKNQTTPPTLVSKGDYQVEIRRGTEYAAPSPAAKVTLQVGQTFDTNDRLVVTQNATAAAISQSFDLVTEYDPYPLNWSQAAGSAGAWSQTATAYSSGPRSFRSGTIVAGQYSSAQLTSVSTSAGTITFDVEIDAATPGNYLLSSYYNSLQFLIDDVAQPWNFAGAGNPTSPFFPNLLSGIGTTSPTFLPASFSIGAGTHKLEWRYTKGANSTVFGTDAAYIDNLVIPNGSPGPARLGDQNVERPQGMVVIEGNYVHDVSGVGIAVDPATRDNVSGAIDATEYPYPGSARATPIVNTPNLMTSIAILNNVVSNFGANGTGIRFGGDSSAVVDPLAIVPMGKIMNNTIYGGGSGYQSLVNFSSIPGATPAEGVGDLQPVCRDQRGDL